MTVAVWKELTIRVKVQGEPSNVDRCFADIYDGVRRGATRKVLEKRYDVQVLAGHITVKPVSF